ncbi:autotransporter [Paraburkholderia phosphatilytica]|uniref:autotransporter n=1 Tax=Paraburkholderia phosphatilytica TaxID=2282883 RepID=UPI000E467639|nr:autotransporter [Paraburkholderia phosphatilytica]
MVNVSAPLPPHQPPLPENQPANGTGAPATGNANVAQPAQQNAPTPSLRNDQSTLGRLANAMSRTGQRMRHAKFDVSTAVSQRTQHGKPMAPVDYTANGTRYPVKPAAASTAAGTPLQKSERESRAALAKTAKSSSSSSGAASGTTTQDVPLDAMDGGAPLLAYIARKMPGPTADPLAASELAHGLAMQGAPAGSPPTTRGTLLAHALHGAQVGDAHEAAETLDTLAKLDFTQMDHARSSSPAEARAWLAARTLSRTDEGFEALEHLRSTVGQTPPEADPSKRLAQRMMLQAADALEPELEAGAHPLARDPAPGMTAARHAPAVGTSLTEAPFAWQAYHSALTLTKYGRASLTDDQKGVFFAWRQNFREDGRGSELSKARERLNKFSAKTIDRGAESRWKSFLPRIFGKHTAPTRALGYGTQGVPRKTIDAERKALQSAMQGALPPLVDRPEMRPAAALSHARPEHSIAELAALHVWLDSGGFPNGHPDAEQLHAIAERAQQMCADLQPRDVGSPATLDRMRRTTAEWAAADPHVLARNPAFKPIAKRPFDMERLAAWGKVAKVPADSPFWGDVDALKRAARPDTSTSTPADITNANDVRGTLKDVARNLQSSSRLRLTDGGRIGISTRGLSANIGKLLHAGAIPVAPRVDVRASKSREGVVELSRSTQGVEMFVGTAKTSVKHAGVGVLVGYDMDVGLTQLRAGVTTSAVLHSQELQEPSGVSLRVARRVNANGTGYDDNAMRDKLSDVIDHVFDEATNARQANTGGARGTWNRLADRYFDDPDVSVSWTDTVSRMVKRGVSADAGVSVKIPSAASPVRAGVNVGIGYERTSRQTLDSNETSGRMQIEQHRVGGGSRLLGKLSGTVSATDNVGEVGVGLVSLDAPSATMTFNDDSRLAKVQLVREDGTLSHRACLLDTEYSSAETYTRAIDASRDQWISLFAAQTEDEQRAERQQAQLHGQPPPVLPPPRQVAAERLDAHLADVKANRRPNQTYFHRYRLKRDAAKQLDVLSALSKQLPKQGAADACAEIDAKVDRILNEPASWMPIELKVKERTTVTRAPGLNFLVQLNSHTSATGDREIFAESIPFALLERMDG